ncbi:competence protein CoiA family protein [Aeromonas veronii]|uniref:competence protein CoiA family protein n=1 Tax=Aeromonas veronii TaxID=654 RepID=UPI001CD696EB|nr:competence protein CoiA family protein [Aeromonas veronii]UBR46218.1 competence protein CoiA [Aeromonas veronii]
METLKVPYGLNDTGELIPAELAQKDSIYLCPFCRVQLIHRAGDKKVKHFSHPPSSNCSLESTLYITAKKLIQSVIENNSKGQQSIILDNHCHNCGVVFSTELPINTFSSAALEFRVGDYICDVVGYRGNSIGLAIEIFNTHKVDKLKSRNLQTYWVELKAEDVIKNPTKWSPTQSKLKDSYCTTCRSHIHHVLKVADEFGIDRTLYSPFKNPDKATYIADVETCFKCKREIPVFWWRGVPFCEVEPPPPKPKTIKFRYSKQFGGSYWANTCANCSMIQGDNYLYIFDNAPFKDLPLSIDDKLSQGSVRVKSDISAVSEFMKIIKRNL